MEIDAGSNKKISVYRERKATKEEKKSDPDAKTMTEWIHIEFSDKEPKIIINRDLCDD
jgi:hypothetical protein